jgi:Methyltransferase domain
MLQCRGLASFKRIIDVGCGDGSAQVFYGAHAPLASWTGIEVWGPYEERFGLRERYDKLIIADAREVPFQPCDLMIFGDVLEHMPEEDAIALWNRARESARYLVVGIPIVPMPQEAWEGNEHEAHVSDWTYEKVLTTFPGIASAARGENVGAFIADGSDLSCMTQSTRG